jgi:hypothetical protein
MAAAWPLVKNRLVAALPGLTGWANVVVYDGPPITSDTPTDFVTVGYVPGEDFAGTYEQTRNGENSWQGALEETGTVRSELVCWAGDSDLATLQTRAFALVDAWEAWVSSDETLGVLGRASVASLSVDVQPIQDQSGAAQRLTVTLSYLAISH